MRNSPRPKPPPPPSQVDYRWNYASLIAILLVTLAACTVTTIFQQTERRAGILSAVWVVWAVLVSLVLLVNHKKHTMH